MAFWRALASLAVVVATPAAAVAEVERVVLIDLPGNLEAAVQTALEPWRVEVVVVRQPSPGPSMPSSAERAAAIAGEHEAGAAVWLAADPSGSALWVFDGNSQRTTARRLPSPPPYDDTTAAAVALSVKTLLRFSAIAPEAERFDGERPVEAEVAPAAPLHPLVFTARAGLRRRGGEVEPRFGVGARVLLPASRVRLMLAGELRVGPGESVDGVDFVGHFSDTVVTAQVGVEFAAFGRVVITPSAGAALRFTAIDGSIPSRQTAARATRLNPTLDAGVVVSADVRAGLLVGLGLDGAFALRRQRYLVGGATVFEVPAAEAELSLLVAVPLP